MRAMQPARLSHQDPCTGGSLIAREAGRNQRAACFKPAAQGTAMGKAWQILTSVAIVAAPAVVVPIIIAIVAPAVGQTVMSMPLLSSKF